MKREVLFGNTSFRIEREKMRLLTEEERQKVDSKPKTIEKWDEFLKKAVHNLGYGKNIIDNMYPYDRGLPMKGTDERLPIGPTGRIFFKMSDADKLAQMLSIVTTTNTHSTERNIHFLLTKLLIEDDTWNEFYPNDNTSVRSRVNKFLEDCDIFRLNNDYNRALQDTFWLNDSEKETFITEPNSIEFSHGIHYLLIFKPWENRYEGTTAVHKAVENILAHSSEYISYEMYCKYKKNWEVYTQDYLVLSLNPIDKLMLSTKQAFSSCMSIAKQNDTNGTNSGPAFGLPAMFNTDSVWLTFMTGGKHKNMYWESEEWKKDPADRDPDKAYKYLKMTCRALTYQGTFRPDIMSVFTKLDANDTLEKDKDKLFVGRQYSANGEDFTWQKMLEVLMGRYGIATAHAYVQEAKTIRPLIPIYKVMSQGVLSGRAPITLDRFGQVRGYYYDNITVRMKPGISTNRNVKQDNFKTEYKIEDDIYQRPVFIDVGSSRTGSGGFASYYASNPGLDMFKMMTGIQNYTYLNQYIPVCACCGDLVEEKAGVDKDGRTICKACAEKLNLKLCEHCNSLYLEDEADEHKPIDIANLIDPDHKGKAKPVIVCKSMLRQAEERENSSSIDKVICGHCGKLVMGAGLPYTLRGHYDRVTYDGITFLVSVCYDCFGKAYVCEKCRKMIFIDTNQDAALLLPNKRIICKDCMDSIRIKKERREEIKYVMENLNQDDVKELLPGENTAPEFTEDYLLKNSTRATLSQHNNFNQAWGSGKFKDVAKQIQSWVKAHPENNFVHLKAVKAVEETEPEPLIERIEEYIGA